MCHFLMIIFICNNYNYYIQNNALSSMCKYMMSDDVCIHAWPNTGNSCCPRITFLHNDNRDDLKNTSDLSITTSRFDSETSIHQLYFIWPHLSSDWSGARGNIAKNCSVVVIFYIVEQLFEQLTGSLTVLRLLCVC